MMPKEAGNGPFRRPLDLHRDLPALTSLRFFAALFVLIVHYTGWYPAHLRDLPVISKGYLGVDFFFILSGFILTHVYIRQIENGSFSFQAFIVKRIARIYPIHLVVLIGAISMLYMAESAGIGPKCCVNFTPVSIGLNVFLLHAWGPTDFANQFNSPSWSVSAEWFAYLVLFVPCVALVFRNRIGGDAVLVLGIIILLICFYGSDFVTGRSFTSLTSYFGVFRLLPEFFYGIVLYRFTRQRICPLWLLRAIFGLSVVGAIGFMFLSVDDVWSILLSGVIIGAGALMSTSDRPWLSSGKFVYLGEISYSMYMVHLPFGYAYFNALKRMGLFSGDYGVIFWCGSFAIVFILSALCYHGIEKPSRRIISSLLGVRAGPRQARNYVPEES